VARRAKASAARPRPLAAGRRRRAPQPDVLGGQGLVGREQGQRLGQLAVELVGPAQRAQEQARALQACAAGGRGVELGDLAEPLRDRRQVALPGSGAAAGLDRRQVARRQAARLLGGGSRRGQVALRGPEGGESQERGRTLARGEERRQRRERLRLLLRLALLPAQRGDRLPGGGGFLPAQAQAQRLAQRPAAVLGGAGGESGVARRGQPLGGIGLAGVARQAGAGQQRRGGSRRVRSSGQGREQIEDLGVAGSEARRLAGGGEIAGVVAAVPARAGSLRERRRPLRRRRLRVRRQARQDLLALPGGQERRQARVGQRAQRRKRGGIALQRLAQQGQAGAGGGLVGGAEDQVRGGGGVGEPGADLGAKRRGAGVAERLGARRLGPRRLAVPGVERRARQPQRHLAVVGPLGRERLQGLAAERGVPDALGEDRLGEEHVPVVRGEDPRLGQGLERPAVVGAVEESGALQPGVGRRSGSRQEARALGPQVGKARVAGPARQRGGALEADRRRLGAAGLLGGVEGAAQVAGSLPRGGELVQRRGRLARREGCQDQALQGAALAGAVAARRGGGGERPQRLGVPGGDRQDRLPAPAGLLRGARQPGSLGEQPGPRRRVGDRGGEAVQDADSLRGAAEAAQDPRQRLQRGAVPRIELQRRLQVAGGAARVGELLLGHLCQRAVGAGAPGGVGRGVAAGGQHRRPAVCGLGPVAQLAGEAGRALVGSGRGVEVGCLAEAEEGVLGLEEPRRPEVAHRRRGAGRAGPVPRGDAQVAAAVPRPDGAQVLAGLLAGARQHLGGGVVAGGEPERVVEVEAGRSRVGAQHEPAQGGVGAAALRLVGRVGGQPTAGAHQRLAVAALAERQEGAQGGEVVPAHRQRHLDGLSQDGGSGSLAGGEAGVGGGQGGVLLAAARRGGREPGQGLGGATRLAAGQPHPGLGRQGRREVRAATRPGCGEVERLVVESLVCREQAEEPGGAEGVAGRDPLGQQRLAGGGGVAGGQERLGAGEGASPLRGREELGVGGGRGRHRAGVPGEAEAALLEPGGDQASALGAGQLPAARGEEAAQGGGQGLGDERGPLLAAQAGGRLHQEKREKRLRERARPVEARGVGEQRDGLVAPGLESQLQGEARTALERAGELGEAGAPGDLEPGQSAAGGVQPRHQGPRRLGLDQELEPEEVAEVLAELRSAGGDVEGEGHARYLEEQLREAHPGKEHLVGEPHHGAPALQRQLEARRTGADRCGRGWARRHAAILPERPSPVAIRAPRPARYRYLAPWAATSGVRRCTTKLRWAW
jgi:hypothetical protein